MPTVVPPPANPRRPARLGHRVPLALLAGIILTLTACGPGGPIRWQLRPDVRRPDPGVVILLVDGVPPRFLEQGCRDGWLPNIDHYLVERGTRVTHAVTIVPSITYAAIATLITGTTPEQHGIVGNRWFDPDRMLFRDYATIATYRSVNEEFATPSLYEMMAPRPSTSVQSVHTRGVSDEIVNWAGSGVRWFFGDYTSVDKLTATTLSEVAARANWTGEWPTVLTLYFPGVDSIGHLHGPRSEQFRVSLENVDHQIGRICDWLDSQDLLESTCLVLMSDHGMVDVRRDGYLDLTHLVGNVWGRNVTQRMLQTGSLRSRSDCFNRFDTVVAPQDGRKAFIYFRSDEGWQEDPPAEEVARILDAPASEDRLWNQAAVDLVAYLADDDEAVVRNSRGTACIRSRRGPNGQVEFAYEPSPDDILGYNHDPELAEFVAQGFHASRDWLGATAGEVYPDVVPQIIPLLHVRRAGQVAVFARPGYSFVHELGGHGGVHRDEMLMTMVFAGPGIPAGATLAAARSVDVVPTVLSFIGFNPDQFPWLRGISLFPATTSASRVPACAVH